MEGGKYIRILRIMFDTTISNKEITLFRGAVLASMQQQGNILFHNHKTDDTFLYRYPLIQYKRIKRLASIVAVEEGADIVGEFLSKDFSTLQIGKEKREFKIGKIIPTRIFMQVWQSEFNYRIRRWLPLNSENYRKYLEAKILLEKIELLESILKGNLLAFYKGLGIFVSEELKAEITFLSEPFIVKNKGVKIMAFDIEFVSNLSLPNFVGIGKNASIGYGIVTRIREE